MEVATFVLIAVLLLALVTVWLGIYYFALHANPSQESSAQEPDPEEPIYILPTDLHQEIGVSPEDGPGIFSLPLSKEAKDTRMLILVGGVILLVLVIVAILYYVRLSKIKQGYFIANGVSTGNLTGENTAADCDAHCRNDSAAQGWNYVEGACDCVEGFGDKPQWSKSDAQDSAAGVFYDVL